MTWQQIDLGRPIQGPEFEPEMSPRDIIGVEVAVDAPASLVRLRLELADEAGAQVVLDVANTYALYTALGRSIAEVGRAWGVPLEALEQHHAANPFAPVGLPELSNGGG